MPQGARCLLLLLFLASLAALPAPASNQPNPCDQAAALVAMPADAPLELLQAIARVESGRSQLGVTKPWPWTVNAKGEGYWFETQDAAMTFAQALLDQGDDNFDLGCFQINLHWHGAEFASLAEALSPQSNAAYAARFLHELFTKEGDWGAAVAAYHSQNAEQGQLYLARVEAMLLQIRGEPSPLPELIATTEPENSFPLFQTGGQSGASLVPLGSGRAPLFSVTP
jgi:hypothetical protein